jgi:hypothetical protein
MAEANELAAEAFLDATVLDAVALQVIRPERQRVLGDRVNRRLNLPDPGRPGTRLYGNVVMTEPTSAFALA